MEKIVVKDTVQESVDRLILDEGRRYFGSSGASLTHELGGEKKTDFARKSLEIGMRGERETTRVLKKWAKDKENIVLVDSVHLKKTGQKNLADGKDTDHVVVIGNSIILIDTKVWKRRKTYRIGKGGTILRSGKNFPGGHVNSLNAMRLWRSYFPEADNVAAMVCIQQRDVFVKYDQQWMKSRFKLIAGDNLVTQLDYLYTRFGAGKTPINTSIAAKVIVSAVKPLDILGTVLNRTSI